MKTRILSYAAVVILALTLPLNVFGHSGRTDKSGGHKDNKNKSGLGSYHYHCDGYPAHLHKDGVCPYKGKAVPSSSSSSSSKSSGSSQSASSSSTKPKKVYASKITAVNIPTTINSGEDVQLEGAVYPTNAEDTSITWASETPEIATISDTGALSATGVGTAVIVATTNKGTTSKFYITVKEVIAEEITISNKPSSIVLTTVYDLDVEFNPANTTNQDILWSSSDDSIITVSNSGKLTANGLGTATITATHNELQDSLQIEVLPIKAESVDITGTYTLKATDTTDYFKIKMGESLQLSSIISPSNTTDKTIAWSTNNKEIASITEKGRLTTHSTGTVVVTAKTENGKKDSITLIVYSNTPLVVGGTTVGAVGIAFGITYFLWKKKRRING